MVWDASAATLTPTRRESLPSQPADDPLEICTRNVSGRFLSDFSYSPACVGFSRATSLFLTRTIIFYIIIYSKLQRGA